MGSLCEGGRWARVTQPWESGSCDASTVDVVSRADSGDLGVRKASVGAIKEV